MSFTLPTVTASGLTYAQAAAAGASGILDALVAANLDPTDAPSAAPALSETGTSGTLPAATYFAVVTELNGFGETTASAVSSGQAITGTEELVITPAAFQAGNTACNIYVGTSSTGPFTLVATEQPHAAFTLSALPTTSWASVRPPSANSTGLESDGTARKMQAIRACKSGNLQSVYNRIAANFDAFNRGNPVDWRESLQAHRDMLAALALLYELCNEIGTLMEANPGTLHNSTNGIGNARVVRQWP